MHTLHLLHLHSVPIVEQLFLEEALLRCDTRNFCLINHGSPPAIVMGISGIFEELIDQEQLEKKKIPVIRRFSGGGTVIVDEETCFLTTILNHDALKIAPFPKPVLEWHGDFLKECLPKNFAVVENDYTLSNHKVGGNAQYFMKNRWLHHSSFLWDFCHEKMCYLKMPKKKPLYREERSHTEFLTKLSNFLPNKELFYQSIKQELAKNFKLVEIRLEDVIHLLDQPHRQSTSLISKDILQV